MTNIVVLTGECEKRGFPNHVSHERHTLLDQTNSYKRACYKTPQDSNIQAPLWKSILLPAEFSFRFLKSISIRVPIGWHMVDTDVCVYVTTLKLIRGPRTERESLFNPFDSIYHKLLLKLSIADTLGKGTKKKDEKKRKNQRWGRSQRYVRTRSNAHCNCIFPAVAASHVSPFPLLRIFFAAFERRSW